MPTRRGGAHRHIARLRSFPHCRYRGRSGDALGTAPGLRGHASWRNLARRLLEARNRQGHGTSRCRRCEGRETAEGARAVLQIAAKRDNRKSASGSSGGSVDTSAERAGASERNARYIGAPTCGMPPRSRDHATHGSLCGAVQVYRNGLPLWGACAERCSASEAAREANDAARIVSTWGNATFWPTHRGLQVRKGLAQLRTSSSQWQAARFFLHGSAQVVLSGSGGGAPPLFAPFFPPA